MARKKGTLLPEWLRNNNGKLGLSNYNKLETRDNYNDIQEQHNARIPAIVPQSPIINTISSANQQRKALNSISLNESMVPLAPVKKNIFQTMFGDPSKGSKFTQAKPTLKESSYAKFKSDNPNTPSLLQPLGYVLDTPYRYAPTQRLLTKAGEFLGANMMNGKGEKLESKSTNNKLLDGAIDIGGIIAGSALTGGSGANLLTGTDALAQYGGVKIAGKTGSKLLGAYGRGAIDAGASTAIEGLSKGKNLKETAKDTAINSVFGGAMFAGGKAIGDVIPKVGNALTPQGLKNQGINDAFDQTFNKKFGEFKKATIPTEKIVKEVTPSVPIKGKFTVKNTALEKATTEYNNAMETIQNHFMTNKLIPEEIARIKPELGIDINKLASNLENAKTNVTEIGNKARLKATAGITEIPNNLNKPFVNASKEVASTIEPPTSKLNNLDTNIPKVNKNVATEVFEPINTTPPPIKNNNVNLEQGKSRFANVTVENSANTAEQLAKDLKKLDLGYDKVTNEQSLIQANKRISDDTEKAVRYVLDTKVGSAEHTTTAIQLINKFQNEGNFDRAIDITESISKSLSKNGQAIQAASIYDRLSPEGILLYAQKKVNKLNDSRWFKGITKEQKINPALAEQLKDLSASMKDLTGDAKIEASQELQQALQSLGKSTVWRKLESAQTIGQLLNPKTAGRNIISNEFFYRLERVNKYVSTPIDIARSKITGGERTVTFKTGNQGGYWEALLKGTKAGWKGTNPGGITTQYDLTAPAFSGKWNPLTYMEKALGANLKGFDHAAYSRAVNQTVGEMGELSAINSGLKGAARKAHVETFVKDANKNILDIADQYGKYATFQDNNVLSKGLSTVKKGMNFGKEFGIGSLVVKYPKTPGALIMRSMEYSPAGFLKSTYELAQPLLKEVGENGKRVPVNTREVTLALSRAITGTLGFTGLGYLLADKGVITGRTDKDKDIREMQKQTGNGSYKVNISALKRWATSGFDVKSLDLQKNDFLYSYDWLAPIAMSVSFGANMNANNKDNKGTLNSTAATLSSSFEGALGTIGEQPVLQGIARQFQGYDLGQNAVNTAKSIPSSFTPTLLNQIRQKQDNTARVTYDPNPLRESFNMAAVKVPGLSGKLLQAYDTEGNVKKTYQNDTNNAWNVFGNPGFASRNTPTPTQKFIEKIYKETGDKDIYPKVGPKKITVAGKPLELTSREFTDYQKYIGEETKKAYEEIAKVASTGDNRNNGNKSPEVQAKEMKKVLSDINTRAKDKFLEGRNLFVDKKQVYGREYGNNPRY